MRHHGHYSILVILCLTFCTVPSNARRILVVGSLNLDTFLSVDRLPTEGENIVTTDRGGEQFNVPGGKGCTQAIAAARLYPHEDVGFVGQFGCDAHILQEALRCAGVNIDHCQQHNDLTSGKGYVFRTTSGQVSAVVSGGSNQRGWKEWEKAWKQRQQDGSASKDHLLAGRLNDMLNDCGCVLLQREVPEYVNRLVATCAREKGILVLQDVGGQDRPIDPQHLACCDYLLPNETELKRLFESFGGKAIDKGKENDTETVVEMARFLQQQSNKPLHVLVTRGSRGALLLTSQGNVIQQAPCHTHQVVDETGAGDCFRAAFAVALMEHKPIEQALQFASAAGACSVEKQGAVPSVPSRKDVETKLHHSQAQDQVLSVPRGDGLGIPSRGGSQEFPFLIGSRLNSMKDRPELWPEPLDNPREFVKRQATIPGLSCVDFNFPQHFHNWTPQEAKDALDKAGLAAGAICLRYPSQFARGAMNHPDPDIRRDAIDLTKQAAEVAQVLGTNEVVVWSAFDGYDYPFQVDYDAKWTELVDAFQELCDEFPHIRFSLEYKPTDENTRFFTVPSTGAAMLLVNEVDRPNFGLTLDVGHMLMAGENPGQSIALVGRSGKLFGIQLNDGYTRLAAEDGLMFGSVHPAMALEIMYQLHRIRFDGHLYFDTFPQRSDPVKEAAYNIMRVKAFWYAACSIDETRLQAVHRDHDAISALELIDDAMRNM